MIDLNEFSNWIGRAEEARDVLTDRILQEFCATFDPYIEKPESGVAPRLIHWCLAPLAVPESGLGNDGHPQKGTFLPPIPLPRRMWASGEVHFLSEINSGDAITRRSVINDVKRKVGKTGELWFVDVQHEIYANSRHAASERQTIVYRDFGSQGQAPMAPIEADTADAFDEIDVSSVRLFRYSALTFNSHRIHYDEPYATEVENYPGLVVHGPMQATFLLHAATKLLQDGEPPAIFRFRGTFPLIAGARMSVRAKRTSDGIECCACDAAGHMTMEASYRVAR